MTQVIVSQLFTSVLRNNSTQIPNRFGIFILIHLSHDHKHLYSTRGRYFWEFVLEMCNPGLQILTILPQTKIRSTPVFRPSAGRNYVIIT